MRTVPTRQHVVNHGDDLVPDWTPAGAAFTGLLMRTFPLERRLSAAGEALAQAGGQTMSRWLILEAVDGGPASVAEIGRRLYLARQGVQRVTDLLAAEGLITYEDNPRHARAKLVAITPLGRGALRRIQHDQRSWANRLGERLGRGSLEQAASVLDAMLAAVIDDMPHVHEVENRP
jgi:DNA-binding MarR family transcriptional regulator